MTKEIKNIFGDKSKFAIEAVLCQNYEYPIFISWCLWIRNNMVGDIGQCAVLSAEIERIAKVTEQKGHRWMLFEDLSAKTITDRLIENIWINGCDTQNPELANIDILSQHGECFQGYYVFLVEQQGYEWLLTKDHIGNKYYDIKLPSGTLYKAFDKLSNWIADSTILVLRTDKASITNG